MLYLVGLREEIHVLLVVKDGAVIDEEVVLTIVRPEIVLQMVDQTHVKVSRELAPVNEGGLTRQEVV
ncbi:hypothetical protein D3C71_2126890 [compost metagenome]